MSEFYTYLWLREDGSPYYAGKGKGQRAFIKEHHNVPPPKDRERIIIQEWMTEEQAYEAERFLIEYYGRIDLGTGCLRNLCAGGIGRMEWSEEEREEQRQRVLKTGNHQLGRKRSLETKLKIKLARAKQDPKSLGHPKSPETRAKISAGRKRWIESHGPSK